MGRADQRTKVKGMFVDPKQIAQLVKESGEIESARLVVSRKDDKDEMKLQVKSLESKNLDTATIAESLKQITKLTGDV